MSKTLNYLFLLLVLALIPLVSADFGIGSRVSEFGLGSKTAQIEKIIGGSSGTSLVLNSTQFERSEDMIPIPGNDSGTPNPLVQFLFENNADDNMSFYNGTNYNGVYDDTIFKEGSYSWDSSDSGYFEFQTNITGNDNWTYSTWIYPTAFSGNQRILYPGVDGYWVNNANDTGWTHIGGISESSVNIPYNEWTLFTISHNSNNTMSIYCNGVMTDSQEISEMNIGTTWQINADGSGSETQPNVRYDNARVYLTADLNASSGSFIGSGNFTWSISLSWLTSLFYPKDNSITYDNYVVCYKNGGLGHCTDSMAGDGTCTCVLNS